MTNKLKVLRTQSMLTQQKVADAIKVPREHIAMWESGSRRPGERHLRALADLYRVTSEFLMDDSLVASVDQEWAALESELRAEDPNEKIELWKKFLDSWYDFRTQKKQTSNGRQKPPKELITAGLISDARRAPTLAGEVRSYYGLGLEPIKDLYAFLDRIGVIVCKAPLGSSDDMISGVFYNHPQLGFSILVNSNTTLARQYFTLAHEFAHALYHYSMLGLVSRDNADDPKEKFANAFASYFLVPTNTLRRLMNQYIDIKATDILNLASYFGVSYKAILIRLRNERLISFQQYSELASERVKEICKKLSIDSELFDFPSNLQEFEIPSSIKTDLWWELFVDHENTTKDIHQHFGNKLSAIVLKQTQDIST